MCRRYDGAKNVYTPSRLQGVQTGGGSRLTAYLRRSRGILCKLSYWNTALFIMRICSFDAPSIMTEWMEANVNKELNFGNGSTMHWRV